MARQQQEQQRKGGVAAGAAAWGMQKQPAAGAEVAMGMGGQGGGLSDFNAPHRLKVAYLDSFYGYLLSHPARVGARALCELPVVRLPSLVGGAVEKLGCRVPAEPRPCAIILMIQAAS